MADNPHIRQSARHPLTLRATFRRNTPGSAIQEGGDVRNLSVAGAFIETRSPPSVGIPVLVTLKAASAWDPLELEALVRWANTEPGEPRGFGVQFTRMGVTEANALYDLINATDFSKNDETNE